MAKWIQGAIKKPGSMTAWCKAHGHKSTTMACIEEAMTAAKKTHDKSLMGKAKFAKRAQEGF